MALNAFNKFNRVDLYPVTLLGGLNTVYSNPLVQSKFGVMIKNDHDSSSGISYKYYRS